MNDYQFWDELGKIFNAVIAYQEKAVEFNKRFINPWIPLGNVFDRQERNRDAVRAYQKAIELDPGNGQNWYELGNVYFHTKDYDQAAEAYARATELAPQNGSVYSNLALTLASQGKLAEAIPLYQKSIDLLIDDKEKAVAWNRLGNVHRKLNEYELAVLAFQKADELDGQNAGFRDELDEIPETPSAAEAPGAILAAGPTAIETIDPLQLIVAEGRAHDAAALQPEVILAGMNGGHPHASDAVEIPEPVKAELDIAHDGAPKETDGAVKPAPPVEEPPENVPASEEAPTVEAKATSSSDDNAGSADTEKTFETFTAVPTTAESAPAATDLAVVEAGRAEMRPEATTKTAATDAEPFGEETAVAGVAVASHPDAAEGASAADAGNQSAAPVDMAKDAAQPHALAEEADVAPSAQASDEAVESQTGQVAYEEYLKDNEQPINIMISESGEPMEPPASGGNPQAPSTKLDSSGELRIEMDAKNAHVWNELGNIYFNNGNYDDAVIAYSKSIELDRWFAWPYSNLALTYVQKSRFAEAILLYQRSIELFREEKDKAISWNRLGNVYRRLNDYEHAISAYQRADELDPDNATLSLQSRFSLLGSFSVEQKPSYVS